MMVGLFMLSSTPFWMMVFLSLLGLLFEILEEGIITLCDQIEAAGLAVSLNEGLHVVKDFEILLNERVTHSNVLRGRLATIG
jgi:hypothetical protein